MKWTLTATSLLIDMEDDRDFVSANNIIWLHDIVGDTHSCIIVSPRLYDTDTEIYIVDHMDGDIEDSVGDTVADADRDFETEPKGNGDGDEVAN